MRPSAALSYIWSYYKIQLLFCAIAVFFLVLIFQAYFGKKPETVFSALLIDTGISQEAADAAAQAYAEYGSYDMEWERVVLDAGLSFRGGTVAGAQKLIVSLAAGEVDIVLTDREITDYLLKSGALSDLQTILPEEVLSGCALVYADAAALRSWSEARRNAGADGTSDEMDEILVSSDRESMAEPVPIGVDVTRVCQTVFGRESAESVILCAAVTTTRREEVGRFLEFLNSREEGAA